MDLLSDEYGVCDKGEFEWVVSSFVLHMLSMDLKKDQVLFR